MLRAVRWVLVLFCSLAILPPTPLLHASQVRLVDLEQMTQRAARIFSGRCIASRVEHDAALGGNVTVATFRVQRAIKGVSGSTVSVRMLAAPSAADEPAGVPSFREGEEVVLFLYGESATGLSAPVGLGQGRFRIFDDKQGRRLALNDFGNSKLMTGLRAEARARLEARGSATARRAAAQRRDEVDPTELLDSAEALLPQEAPGATGDGAAVER